MSGDTFDKLAGSRPVNSQAARVMGRGVEYTPNKRIGCEHWSAPPAMKRFIPNGTNPQIVDLTGVKFGRFSVVGYFGKASKNSKAKWVVRCACGDYELRSARAIRNPENFGDRCSNCLHLAYLKRTTDWRANPSAPEKDLRTY